VVTIAIVTALSYSLLASSQYMLALGIHPVESYALYLVAIGGAMFAYVRSLWHAHHDAHRSRRWLLVLPLVLQFAWLIPLPRLSIDAYSYVVDAATIRSGANPYQHPVKDARDTPLGRELIRYGWRPTHDISPYGPVWMHLMRGVGRLTSDPVAEVRLVKLIAMLSTVLAGLFLYGLAEPSERLIALTAFWWNPAVIVETAGEGHNDAVMIVAVLMALWALVRRWPTLAASALSTAILVKYVPAMFALPCLAFAWWTGLVSRRTIAASVLVAGMIGVASFYALWAGAGTFAGLRQAAYPHVVASSSGVLLSLIPGSTLVIRLLRVAAVLTTGLIVIAATIRVTDRPIDLLRACSCIALLYTIVAAPMFWPWYMLLPIALLAATRDLTLLVAVTIASRLIAPLEVLRVHGVLGWSVEAWLTTIVALWAPLGLVAWQRTRHRPAVVWARRSAG
jgi:hypothetical protein